MYTGFVAPADDVVDDVVARALGAAGERVPRGDWQRSGFYQGPGRTDDWRGRRLAHGTPTFCGNRR